MYWVVVIICNLIHLILLQKIDNIQFISLQKVNKLFFYLISCPDPYHVQNTKKKNVSYQTVEFLITYISAENFTYVDDRVYILMQECLKISQYQNRFGQFFFRLIILYIL